MSTICSICGDTARFMREDKLLCEICYQARVPSWSRSASDLLEGSDPDPDEPAQGSRTWLLYGIGKRLVISILATIMFSVVTFRAALDAEWGDVAVGAPVLLLVGVLTRKQWRHWRAATGKGEELD
jgi:hypothetical protein